MRRAHSFGRCALMFWGGWEADVGANAVETACTQGEGLILEAEGPGTRSRGGARRENVAHVCDAGRVELQRLVECRCALPSRKERASLR